MILNFIWFLGLIMLFSQVTSVICTFFSLEVIFFFLIMVFGQLGSGVMYIWSLVLVVGGAVFGLSLIVSGSSFFGSDSQSSFLD